MALVAGRRRSHLIGWWKGKPAFAAQCCPAPGSGSGSGSGASGGGEKERALKIGWWKGKPAYAYACCVGAGSGSGSGSGGGIKHLARLIGWWKGKPAWAYECCVEPGVGSEGSYGSGSGSYGSQASGSYGSLESGSYGSGSAGSEGSGSGLGGSGSGSGGSEGSGSSGSLGSGLSGSGSGLEGSGASGSGQSGSGPLGSGQSGSAGSAGSGSSGSGLTGGSVGSSGSGPRGSAGSGGQGSQGSGSSGSGSGGSGSSGSSGSGPRGSSGSGPRGSAGSAGSGSSGSGSGSGGSGSSGSSGSGPRGSSGSGPRGSGAAGGSGSSGSGSGGSGSGSSGSGGRISGSGAQSGMTGGSGCCNPMPDRVCAQYRVSAGTLISTNGCTPCPTSVETWSFTLSGITNGSCAGCTGFNKTWYLNWLQTCAGQPGCNWKSDNSQQVAWCGSGNYSWFLEYGLGPDGVGWYLFVAQSCAVNMETGGFLYYKLKAGTTFDCTGPNVFSKLATLGPTLCNGMPAEITITPSGSSVGSAGPGSSSSSGPSCEGTVCMIWDGLMHVGQVVILGVVHTFRLICVNPSLGALGYAIEVEDNVGPVRITVDDNSTCTRLVVTAHTGILCGEADVIITWDASCCYGSGSGSGSGGSGSGSSGSGPSGGGGGSCECLCIEYDITVSGIANGSCTNCSVLNGTFHLMEDADPNVACGWTSSEIEDPCSAVPHPLYKLFRFGGGFRLAAYANGSTFAWWDLNTPISQCDPAGTYTLGSSPGVCTSLPATITVSACVSAHSSMTAPEGIGVEERQDRPLPGLLTMGVNFLRSATRHVAHGLPMAGDEEAKRRLAICQECPELRSDGRCAACGCGVKDKTSWALEKCPRNKW